MEGADAAASASAASNALTGLSDVRWSSGRSRGDCMLSEDIDCRSDGFQREWISTSWKAIGTATKMFGKPAVAGVAGATGAATQRRTNQPRPLHRRLHQRSGLESEHRQRRLRTTMVRPI